MIQDRVVSLPHGTTLHCRTSGPAGAPVLLFLHGFPEGAFVWDSLLEHFAQPDNGGYRCVAPWLRGFGPSSAPTDAPAAIVMPSSSAAYLNHPRPSYPSISRRMGEQGKVMLRVFVNAQGQPEQIQIQQSSGFDRLDKAAVDAVRRWKFTPGSRNGVAEAMWNIVPINFVLE